MNTWRPPPTTRGAWRWNSSYCPLWLETLVDGCRFPGTCYRAANRILLGETKGRGRMDRSHQADGSARKLIFLYPLCPNPQQRLCEARLPRLSKAQAERDWA